MPKGVMLSQFNLVTNVATITGNDPEYMLRAGGRIQDITIGRTAGSGEKQLVGWQDLGHNHEYMYI
jgi:hypothetical protein